jgi:hypothetical protein
MRLLIGIFPNIILVHYIFSMCAPFFNCGISKGVGSKEYFPLTAANTKDLYRDFSKVYSAVDCALKKGVFGKFQGITGVILIRASYKILV